jgi:hypothetical protein
VATGLAHVWLAGSESQGRVLDFIHDFNGWVMMPVGLTFLLLELWLFKHLLIERTTVGGPRSPKPAPAAAPTPAVKPKFASVIQMPLGR